MKARTSVKLKIGMVVAFSYLAIAVTVLLINSHKIREIFSVEMDAVYQGELSLIHAFLTQQSERLSASGLQDLYGGGYKTTQLSTLARLSDETKGKGYPLILTTQGQVLLHDTLKEGYTLDTQSSLLQRAENQRSGIVTDTIAGRSYWVTFQRFEPWNWITAYAVTEEERYSRINQIVYFIAVVIGVSSLLFLFVLM